MNPKTKEDSQLALDWINLKDNLFKIGNDTDDISTYLVKIREAYEHIEVFFGEYKALEIVRSCKNNYEKGQYIK